MFGREPDGRERSWLLNPELEYTTPAGDTVMAEAFFEVDRPADGYAPVPATWIAASRYRWHYLYTWFDTAHSRPLWISGELRAGGYYDGQRNGQAINLGWKPGPRWEARVGLGRNAIALPTGDFTVKRATSRLDYTPDTQAAHSLLVQLDNPSDSLGPSARLRWGWGNEREVNLALDHLGYTNEPTLPNQTRATLKLAWHFER